MKRLSWRRTLTKLILSSRTDAANGFRAGMAALARNLLVKTGERKGRAGMAEF